MRRIGPVAAAIALLSLAEAAGGTIPPLGVDISAKGKTSEKYGPAERHGRVRRPGKLQEITQVKEFEVLIENRSTNRFTGLKGSFDVIVKSVAGGSLEVLKSSPVVAFDLPPLAEKVILTHKETIKYAPPEAEGAPSGAKYAGYWLKLFDDGKLVVDEAEPASVRKWADERPAPAAK